jgi:sec-independent protein translocase protein TatA
MFGNLGYFEMMLFGAVALMLFGSRLPEVARNLGGTYRGLKRSVDEFKREFQAVETYEPKAPRITQEDEPESLESTAPKFSPPTEDEHSSTPKDTADSK